MKRLLFSFLFILTAIAGWAQEPTTFTVGNFKYTVTDDENHYVSVAQNGDNQPSGAVVIPSSVTHDAVTYTVTSIADNGFNSNEDITEVTIPNTVTSIGESAFVSCSELTTITLPSTLTSIGNSAFYYCSSLASFSVPGSVTTIGSMVFDGCSIPTFTFEASNTAITCNSVIPCTDHLYLNRDIIKDGALTNSIKSLTIGAHVTTIYNSMFNESQYLNSIDFSEATGLESIGNNAFEGCGNFDGSEEVPALHLTTVDLSNTKVTSIGESAFISCTKLTTITLPNTLTSIGNYAFHSCSSLASFSVPGSVETIGSMVFESCSIPTFTFEASNTAITCSATIPCTNLYLGRDINFTANGFSGVSALTIGTNVTSIGSLFYYSNITSVTVPWDSPITIADDAFSDDTFTSATLWIPGGTQDAYEAADGWKKFDNMEFSSFVVSITGSAHGTLAVGEISSTNNKTATTLIDRGEDAVFTVTPATGYELTTFTVNSVAQTPTAGKYTVEDLSANQTVVAGFTPITYTLTYTMNGGTATPANPATYTIETTTFTLTNPTKTGYTFAGWKLNGEGDALMTVTITKGSTGDLKYTATWTPTVYNIVYTDGGTATPANPTTYTIETPTFTLTNPTKTGYTFKGWKLNGEGEAMMTVTITQGSTGALAYTATWQINQYTITFDSKGGTEIDAIKQDYATEVEAPTNPERTGYTFAGWNPGVPATIPAENITCVAQWTINQYTITFNTAGGSVIAPITQDYATAVVAPANPTREGYTFAGWDKDIPTTIPAENVTINATWTPVNYTISYELDGGTVDGSNPTLYTIESAPITLINPTKDGYDFAGWTGTGLDAATKTVIIATGNTGNRSYTATWTKKTYTVSITGVGVTADNTTPEYGDNVVLTIMDDPDATLTSLTVNGTEVKDDIVANQYTIENVSGNISVVATWNSTKEFITLGSDIATFSCTQDLNFTGSELKAYIAAGYSKDGNEVLLVRVYDVPANTGLVIKGTQGDTYKIPYSTSLSYFVNMLKAHTTDEAVPVTEGDYTNFILQKNGGDYIWNHKGEGTMSLGANKAYLQLPTSFVSSSAREMHMVFEDELTPTEIRDNYILLQESKYNGRIYNVSGQQIETLQKGVNIVNGLKILK